MRKKREKKRGKKIKKFVNKKKRKTDAKGQAGEPRSAASCRLRTQASCCGRGVGGWGVIREGEGKVCVGGWGGGGVGGGV